MLLGATWLILKTEGELQRKSVAWARWGLLWVALGVALVSLAHAARQRDGARASGSTSRARSALMVLPAATLAAGAWLWHRDGAMKRGDASRDWQPFAAAVAIFTLAFLGLAYSLFPTW